jgi:hypothetical protein
MKAGQRGRVGIISSSKADLSASRYYTRFVFESVGGGHPVYVIGFFPFQHDAIIIEGSALVDSRRNESSRPLREILGGAN